MKGKHTRSVPDHYAQRAKKEGYPARSVYKLKELQQKHSLLGRGDTVLDLGAAPGSWSIYASEIVTSTGKVIGIDITPWEVQGRGGEITCAIGDIFDNAFISSLLQDNIPNVIISDAAPATTGNRAVDSARSMDLAEQVFTLCSNYLAKNGNMTVKLFQGPGVKEYTDKVRTLFETVKLFKPKACRTNSFEVYIIGIGKLTYKNNNN